MCSTNPSYSTPGKVYTQKELMLLETLISKFHKKYHTQEIQKLEFHLPHVGMLGMHHSGKERCETFKRRMKKHDVLCWSDYAEQIVTICAHQIQHA